MNYWQNKKTGVIISRDSSYTFHPFFWVLIGSADTNVADNDTDINVVDDTTNDTDIDNTDDDSIISEILSKNTENNQFEDYNDLVKNADKTKTAYIGDASYNYVDSRWRKNG